MPEEDTRLVHLPRAALQAQSGSSLPSWPGGEGKGSQETGPQFQALTCFSCFVLSTPTPPSGWNTGVVIRMEEELGSKGSVNTFFKKRKERAERRLGQARRP